MAIASLAIGTSGLTLAVATWAAWLIVRPSVLALVFGVRAGARTWPGPGRIGATLAVVTALLALSGAAVFATTSWRQVGPPVAYFDTQTGPAR